MSGELLTTEVHEIAAKLAIEKEINKFIGNFNVEAIKHIDGFGLALPNEQKIITAIKAKVKKSGWDCVEYRIRGEGKNRGLWIAKKIPLLHKIFFIIFGANR